MLGYSEEDLRRLTYIDLTPEEWHAFEARIVEEQILVKGYSDVYQKEYRKKDGTVFPVELRTFLVRDKAGHPNAMWAIVRDITERKRAERNLSESRKRLQIVLDTIPAAAFWKDRDSVYVGANRAWLDAAGLNSSQEVVGKSDYDLPWGKDQANSYREHDRKVMESGVPEYAIVEPYTRADGTLAWAKTNKVPLRDLEGNVVGILGTYEDITERKQAEQALQFETQRLRVLSENSPFGMVIIGKDGDFEYVNPKFTEIFGYDLNDVPNGRDWIQKAYPDRAYRHEVVSAWKGAFEGLPPGEAVSRAFAVRCKDGSHKIINFSVVKLGTGEGLMICEDITDRTRSEEKIKKAQVALSESEERYRAVFDNAGVGIDLVDRDGRFVQVNNALIEHARLH